MKSIYQSLASLILRLVTGTIASLITSLKELKSSISSSFYEAWLDEQINESFKSRVRKFYKEHNVPKSTRGIINALRLKTNLLLSFSLFLHTSSAIYFTFIFKLSCFLPIILISIFNVILNNKKTEKKIDINKDWPRTAVCIWLLQIWLFSGLFDYIIKISWSSIYLYIGFSIILATLLLPTIIYSSIMALKYKYKQKIDNNLNSKKNKESLEPIKKSNLVGYSLLFIRILDALTLFIIQSIICFFTIYIVIGRLCFEVSEMTIKIIEKLLPDAALSLLYSMGDAVVVLVTLCFFLFIFLLTCNLLNYLSRDLAQKFLLNYEYSSVMG